MRGHALTLDAKNQIIAKPLMMRCKRGSAAFIAKALGVVARAKGMSTVATETGLSREQLYRSLSDQGNPTLKTTRAAMKALGFGLTIKNT